MKSYIAMMFGTVIALAVLLGMAGTVAWWNAWVFLSFMTLTGAFTRRCINDAPGLAEERKTAVAKAKLWDKKVVRLINLALPAMLATAALDKRLGWYPTVSWVLSLAALAAMIPAALLIYRAIAVNRFFSSHVRIQRDRGQTVVSTGPYRRVRHPGYAGSILFNLLVPLALGSYAALVPGVGTAMLLAYRTAKEDGILKEELPGCVAYAEQVPDRLIPGIW